MFEGCVRVMLWIERRDGIIVIIAIIVIIVTCSLGPIWVAIAFTKGRTAMPPAHIKAP